MTYIRRQVKNGHTYLSRVCSYRYKEAGRVKQVITYIGKVVEGSYNYYDGCGVIKAMILHCTNKKVPSLAPIRRKTNIKILKPDFALSYYYDSHLK